MVAAPGVQSVPSSSGLSVQLPPRSQTPALQASASPRHPSSLMHSGIGPVLLEVSPLELLSPPGQVQAPNAVPSALQVRIPALPSVHVQSCVALGVQLVDPVLSDAAVVSAVTLDVPSDDPPAEDPPSSPTSPAVMLAFGLKQPVMEKAAMSDLVATETLRMLSRSYTTDERGG